MYNSVQPSVGIQKPGLPVEMQLFNYLNSSLSPDAMLSETIIQQLLSQAGSRPLNLNVKPNGERMLMLQSVVLNTATPAPTQQNIVAKLIQLGASPDAEDDDGDTALAVLLALAKEYMEDEEDLSESILTAQLGTIEVLLNCKNRKVIKDEVKQVCSWLRNFAPKKGNLQQRVLDTLIKRFGHSEVSSMWNSEQLLEYLDSKAYDAKRSVEAVQVLDFLEKGASPRHSQNGATALALVILNPHNRYEELVPVFRAMLKKDPYCVTLKDGFKLLPLQWAADYRNVSSQHNLPRPNPASFLALLPSIVENTPADVDAGEVCMNTQAIDMTCAQVNTMPHKQLRFTVGDVVLCRVQVPGGKCVWEEGFVIGLWYREDCWPDSHPGAPYEVKLLIGLCVFALVDHDRIIRRPKVKQDVPSAQRGNGMKGARFQRRQKDDGSWELLDTVSGKCKPLPSDFQDLEDSD